MRTMLVFENNWMPWYFKRIRWKPGSFVAGYKVFSRSGWRCRSQNGINGSVASEMDGIHFVFGWKVHQSRVVTCFRCFRSEQNICITQLCGDKRVRRLNATPSTPVPRGTTVLCFLCLKTGGNTQIPSRLGGISLNLSWFTVKFHKSERSLFKST